MNWLDMRTVMFGHIVTNALGVIIIFVLVGQSRGRFRGIPRWLIGYSLQLAGSILITLRGAIPGWISIILANTLILVGALIIIHGLLLFIGKTAAPLPIYLLLTAYFVAYCYFVYIRPSLEARTLIHSSAFAAVFLAAIVVLSRASPEFQRFLFRIQLVYGLIALCALARLAAVIVHPISSQDFFAARSIETLVLLGYQAGNILLAYNLILAVNERLIADTRLQEEKYSKAFQSSPYAILLTDVATGRIIEVNEGFTRITGYGPDEAVGKTTFELRLWEHDEDRVKALTALNAGGRVQDLEFRFRAKSGRMIAGSFSAELLEIAGRPSLFASINDITIRKKALEDLSRSVQEKELLMRELTHRVKNSLNVVSSLIGFSREAASDPGVKSALTDLRTRIGSVSSVYEQLAQTGQVDRIGLKAYVRNLAERLAKSYGPTDGRIQMKMDLADLSLDPKKALPLGLILNELIINAFKYAYPNGEAGEIRIETKSVTGGLCLTVSDDGIGKKTRAGARESDGIGSMVVESLADQIGAHISYPPGPGTTAVIVL